tara:strand:- start:1243 stop:2544 length:1302 start_codon:yes stop_codon:yes gene_type:complete
MDENYREEEQDLTNPNKKINTGKFFNRVDEIDKVASDALSKSNKNFSAINNLQLLIQNISMSIDSMKTEIRDIANYIIVEKKIEKDAEEDRRVEAQDAEQKRLMTEKALAQSSKGGVSPSPQTGEFEKESKERGGGGFFGGLMKVVAGLGLAAGFVALAPIIGPAILGVLKYALVGLVAATVLPKLMDFAGKALKSIGNQFNKLKAGLEKRFTAMKESFIKNFNKLKDAVGNIAKKGFEKTKRGIAGAADFLTGGRFDFDKQGGSESDKLFLPAMAGVGDFLTGGRFDFDKKGTTKLEEKVQDAQNKAVEFAKDKAQDIKETLVQRKDDVVSGAKAVADAVNPVKNASRMLRVLGGIADKVTGDRFDLDGQGPSPVTTPDNIALVPKNTPQVTSAALIPTTPTIPFVRALDNNYLSISPNRNKLPPEIAKLIQ